MALKLTPDDSRKLADKQLANVIRKLNSGKTLTAREEAILAQAKAGDPEEDPAGYVSKWDELADALHVDRRTLTEFRRTHGVEIKKFGTRLTRADGRHVVAAWQELAQRKGMRGRGVNAEAADKRLEGDGLESKYTLDKRRLKGQIEKEEFELACKKQAMLPVADFEHSLGHMMANCRQSLDALPSRCAGLLGELDVRSAARELLREALAKVRAAKTEDAAMQVVELEIVQLLPEPDYHYRREIIEKEVEIVKRTIRECRYIEPGPIQPAARDAVPRAPVNEPEGPETVDDDGED